MSPTAILCVRQKGTVHYYTTASPRCWVWCVRSALHRRSLQYAPVEGGCAPTRRADLTIFPPSAKEQLSGVPPTRRLSTGSRPAKGGMHWPRHLPRRLLPCTEQLSGVSLTSAVRPTREGGCAPMRQPRHLTAVSPVYCQAAARRAMHAQPVRPAKGAAHPCASPAIFPPSATEQLSRVSFTRGP
jgi:hypothetical protein